MNESTEECSPFKDRKKKTHMSLNDKKRLAREKAEQYNGNNNGASGTSRVRQYHILTPEEIKAGRETHWTEMEIIGSVKNLSPVLWTNTMLTGLYLNDNQLTRIPSDISNLVNLTNLDLSGNKLRSIPAEVGELIYLRELLLGYNMLRSLPHELGRCFQLQVLTLNGNPLCQDLLKIFGEPNGTHRLLMFLLDGLQVRVPVPPGRPWIPLSRPNKNIPSCPVTVMCYNVLCEKYATTQMYGYCPSWALSWDYRKKVILGEIRHYTADIITLQEVETDQFYNFFLPELKKDGYDGVFSPKSRAKTMSENDRKRVDGCAIFYRAIKFTLIKEHLIEFNQLAMANSSGSDDMLNRVMPRDNIGLAALLKTNETAWENSLPSEVQQPILVCTAHIHWDPEFCDVKLIQIMMLANELNTILEDANRNYRSVNHHQPPPIQLLLCGDFNSLPDSGVIEFLSAGKVSSDHQDFKDLQYKTLLQKISSCDRPNEFTHSFKLSSAYENIMPFTNYTFNFKGIIDYIFYTRQTMTPLGLLGPLAPEWFKDNKVLGCPHPHIPSDHFPLLVEFELSPNAHQNNSNGLIGRR